jgi:hypothetical protein
MRCPVRLRRTRVRPCRYCSMSRRRPGESFPWQLYGSLDRRLHQRARRPALNPSDVRVPCSRQQPSECIVDRPPGLTAIAQQAIENSLVDLHGWDVVGGTEPHQRRQPRAGHAIADLGSQAFPRGSQRRSVLGNAFLSRQPKQGALHVALVVLHRLRGQAGRYFVQLSEVGANGAIAGRNHLQRFAPHLGNPPQGGRPLPLPLLGELVRGSNDRDGIGEGSLDQHGGLGHWERRLLACDGRGLL